MFGRSLRSTFTKLSSDAKKMASKTASRFKHKGSISEIPDESYCFGVLFDVSSWEEHITKLRTNYEETLSLVGAVLFWIIDRNIVWDCL